MIKFFILLLILLAFFTAIYSIWRFKEPVKTPTAALITINDVVVEAERADSFLKRQQGLSGRKQLKENGGMFFIFDKPAAYPFWMKDMEFPIDIIWIDENYRVVDITKNALPESFPKIFLPSKPVKYVLEVNAGFADKNNISVNDKIEMV